MCRDVLIRWINDLHGVVTWPVIQEFLHVWGMLSDFSLQPGIPDKHLWKLSSSGLYSAKSANEALFQGAVHFGPWERIWKGEIWLNVPSSSG